MKMKSLVYAGLGALALSASAFAQSQVNQHNVSINLKVVFEGPAQEKYTESSSKDTYTSKSKFITGKFSNKEFLEALVEDGLISDIKGWSVVFLASQEGEPYGLYIVKKNVEPINVTDYLDYELCDVVAEWDYKEVDYSNGDFEWTEKSTERGTSRVWLELPYLCASLRGSFTLKYDTTFFSPDGQMAKAPPVGFYEKSTGGSLDSLVGKGSYEDEDNSEASVKGSSEEDDETVLIEGSIGVGGAKLVSFGFDD